MEETIKQYLESGLSVIPIHAEMKTPKVGSWKRYQDKIATMQEAGDWQLPIAIIGGKVSGGVICIDFDNKGSEFGGWTQGMADIEPELLHKLTVQRTPSEGLHAVYRCKDANIRNIKLARKDKETILIETRGEGGYFIVAPSKGYKVLEGDFKALQEVTSDEHDILISQCKLHNRYYQESQEPNLGFTPSGLSPYDDYDAKNNPVDLLINQGWTIVYTKNDAVYLRRPNKNKGISASWNHVPNRLYVFSTSTQFENEHVYKASHVYAIIEHNGDYKAAARALYDKGYGSRSDGDKIKEKAPPKSVVIRISDIDARINTFIKHGLPNGLSTGWQNLDEHYTICKGQMNIITGIPGHGKSTFIDALSVNLARRYGWKFLVYSPENYPFELHFKYLAEKYACMPLEKHQNIEMLKNFVDQHYLFVDIPTDGITIGELLSHADTNQVDGLIIDPWNELETMRPPGQSETDFIREWLMRIRRFARKKNIAVWIVTHPAKLRRDKNGEYPKPTLYDIADSAHWKNKSDNGIVIWRDFENNYTEIIVSKIKFSNYGYPGTVCLRWRREDGNFEEIEKPSTRQNWAVG